MNVATPSPRRWRRATPTAVRMPALGSGRTGVLGLLALLVLLAVATAPHSAHAADPPPGPVIQTETTTVVPGERVELTLTGWPMGVIAVSFCGQSAVRGSADCATEASTTITVGADGTGTGGIHAAPPPSGCPCVVRGTTLTGGTTAVLPVVLAGEPARPAEAADPAEPADDGPDQSAPEESARVVVASAVDTDPGWRDRLLGLLTGGRSHTLVLTVQNTGDVALDQRTVQVLSGRNEMGGDPVAEVRIGALEPGASAGYSVPLRLDAPSFGRYVLHGALDPADPGSVFVAEVETWPVLPPLVTLFGAVWLALRRSRYGGVASLRSLTVTALVAALVLAGHWGATRWAGEARARDAQAELLRQFAPALGSAAQSAEAGGQPVLAAGTLPSPATGDLAGVLRFPSLGADLELAVVEGVSPGQLGRGPGHYPGTALPGEIGNAVVAGHNNRSGPGGPFQRMDELAVGDPIRFETPSGSWTYTVTGTRVVPPTEVSVLLPVRGRPGLAPSGAQLTLITCDYSQGTETERLIIEAEVQDPLPLEGTAPDAAGRPADGRTGGGPP